MKSLDFPALSIPPAEVPAAMFWKKKDQPADKKPSRSLRKKAERRFFHVFNNKSKARRVVFVGILAWFPAYGGTLLMQDVPDTERKPDSAEKVQQYEGDIRRIAANSRDAATAVTVNIDGVELAKRLALDTGISEQDARLLARQFLRDVESGNINPSLMRVMRGIESNAAFLDEARAEIDAASSGGNDAARVIDILKEANKMDNDSYWYRFFIAYVFLFPAMQSGVNTMLRRGARRDDELKQEERREVIEDKVRDIRDMMAPKSPLPKPPAKKGNGPK